MSAPTRRKRFVISTAYGAFSAILVLFGMAVAHGPALIAVLFALVLAPIFFLSAIFDFGRNLSPPLMFSVVFVVQTFAEMPVKNGPVIEAMKQLSGQYPRFGSRRIRVMLARQGIVLGKERCSTLWAKAGLQVPAKRRRRRAADSRLRPPVPAARNSVWCYDFVFDACANGQQLKCLTLVDEYTRECLAIDVAGSIRSKRVIDVLSRMISLHGAPRYIRSDNGPEFVSAALLKWAVEEKIETVFIDPGKPWQNGTNESFNVKFRDECLAMEWFRNRIEAKIVIEDWRTHYNEVRPHSSLQYATPAEFRRCCEISSTNGAESF